MAAGPPAAAAAAETQQKQDRSRQVQTDGAGKKVKFNKKMFYDPAGAELDVQQSMS
jgi:hypothetical protein